MNPLTDNRSRILECALKLFATRGYDSVGIQEIVNAAGITKPTLYHYFGSKKGLLDTLIAEQGAPVLEAVRASADYEFDLSVTLKKIVIRWAAQARANPDFYRMLLALSFAPPENEAHQAIRPWNQTLTRIIEELFVRAAADHGNMKGRHQAYAATLIGIVNSYIGMALNGYCELSEELVSRAIHQYLHGIYS
jgi:TetR/AcrR family transcriptional regulator